jgi:protein O-GlcNAc transferase
MMMTPQNAMRQQQQHQQLDRGLAMFVRDPVKLDPTEHCPHVLTSPSEIMFSGVVDACVDEERLLGAAHQEYKAGNYKQALKHCSLVHEKNPQRTDALLLLGAIYYQLCDFDMCIVKNEEAIRIEPQFAECYGNMANALKVCVFFVLMGRMMTSETIVQCQLLSKLSQNLIAIVLT